MGQIGGPARPELLGLPCTDMADLRVVCVRTLGRDPSCLTDVKLGSSKRTSTTRRPPRLVLVQQRKAL